MNLLLTIKTYSGVNIVRSIVFIFKLSKKRTERKVKTSLAVRFFIEQNGCAIIISYLLIYFACLQ